MSRDNFAIELPSPRLSATSNGVMKSPPNSLKSPNDRRGLSFSREGILGSAQKARNLSQSSGDRDSATNGLQNRKDSDDGINPLKRRNTDAGSDYPRRRATIAVCTQRSTIVFKLTCIVVRNMQVPKIALRWIEAEVSPLC